MTVKEILSELKTLGNEKVKVHNAKYGAGDNQFGVKMGDIRSMAKNSTTMDFQPIVVELILVDFMVFLLKKGLQNSNP